MSTFTTQRDYHLWKRLRHYRGNWPRRSPSLSKFSERQRPSFTISFTTSSVTTQSTWTTKRCTFLLYYLKSLYDVESIYLWEFWTVACVYVNGDTYTYTYKVTTLYFWEFRTVAGVNGDIRHTSGLMSPLVLLLRKGEVFRTVLQRHVVHVLVRKKKSQKSVA